MTEVIMPKMGDGMEEGTLLEWLRKDGDSVKSGEIIGTIQTDKATLELEAPGTGVLRGLLIKGGETVPVGKPIAVLLKEGEKLPESWGSGKATEQPALVGVASSAPVNVVSVNSAEQNGDRVKASPLARKIAAERGIDLFAVAGTGPGGRIIERDLDVAMPPKVAASLASQGDQGVKLNKLRQITAQRTAQSKQEVPHYYVTVEVNLDAIADLRERFEAEESGKVSINDFVVKACVDALVAMPVVNSSFNSDGTLTQFGAINIGLAVAIEDGLTVPVMRNAQNLSLRQISTRSKDLAGRARENRLALDELSGSTFSISNMGMLKVDNFIAIINQPNAAILAVSSASKKVGVDENDELYVSLRMNVTASFDHRVVDGAVGAKFINLVRDGLENPTRLLG